MTAKIIDLGLAKAVNEPGFQTAISMAGTFVGTPEFASPEQFAGVGVDIRSDLYSLGVVLWEMVTGHAVFRGSPAEVMYQHQHAPLPVEQLQGVREPVVVLLKVLLEKDPARRFQTPNELLKTMPAVMRAVDTGRTIKDRKLRAPSVDMSGFRDQQSSLIGISERSVAVLPFDTLSDERRDAYFADGVQDEILSTLAKGSRLRVVSRTSVMRYRASGNRNLPSIAAALGVANVVEGTVRRSGNRVRIVVRLVAARRDETLWSDSYDRELTDIFAIQRDIAKTVASKLSVRLAPEEQKGIEEKPIADDNRPFVADPEFTPFDLDVLGCDPKSAPASPSDPTQVRSPKDAVRREFPIPQLVAGLPWRFAQDIKRPTVPEAEFAPLDLLYISRK